VRLDKRDTERDRGAIAQLLGVGPWATMCDPWFENIAFGAPLPGRCLFLLSRHHPESVHESFTTRSDGHGTTILVYVCILIQFSNANIDESNIYKCVDV